ncbi:MAG: efflux RND transporter permease subunit [Synergistaceae bacterium]|nr:efflux RND transporter permease subunit [Synergistaceae bacterium]
MKHFNLSEWALEHQQFCYFLMALFFIAGIASYFQLGRDEDPPYTIRTMVVSAVWPGASALEMEMQVTDKIEKKLKDLPSLDYLKSYSKPGVSVIYVNLDDYVLKHEIPVTWQKVRGMVNDIVPTLPQGTLPPMFQDDFGDTFGSIYALYGNDFSHKELSDTAEWIRKMILTIPDVSKVSFSGVRTEKIFVEAETAKLASFGIVPASIAQAISDQNKMTPAGMLTTPSRNLYSRLSGTLDSVKMIEDAVVYTPSGVIHVSDIANVRRGYSEDPPDPTMYFNGNPAITIEVSMREGANILALEKSLGQILDRVRSELPAGMEIDQVSNQPKVVRESIHTFVETLVLAILIVLAVNFVSLGWRAGFVVALSIPLVLCVVLLTMDALNINLHKISLGALVISLGLLVDDAIIAIEMMELKLEEGMDKLHAASFAYTATSFPMLTGTIITIAGFMPVAFSSGSASEYVGNIFSVVGIALIVSWVVSVTAIPLLGVRLLNTRPKPGAEHGHSEGAPSKAFRGFLTLCLRHRWVVIGVTLAMFVTALYGYRFVKQEFFPGSTRPELLVDMELPVGSSLKATENEARRFIEMIKDDESIENMATYVGVGSSRFVLVLDTKLANDYFSQSVILTKSEEERDELRRKLNEEIFPMFPDVRMRAYTLTNGPPSPYPVMLRVVGTNREETVALAERVRAVLREDPRVTDITFNWYEMSPAMSFEIDQDKVRSLGINNSMLATSMQTAISGIPIAEFRESDKTIGVHLRSPAEERGNVNGLLNLNAHIGGGKYVLLDQVARIEPTMELPVIWRRDGMPTITIQGDIIPGVTGNDVSRAAWKALAPLRESLPLGYEIQKGGDAESSEKGTSRLLGVVPLMTIVILITLMIQLQHNGKMLLVLITAPFGIIGVVAIMLLLQQAMGFVAILGLLALSGMIIRNTVILVDQITKHVAQGEDEWHAIIDSTLLRFRPIMLTALAAILGMIPLFRDKFWGPMAVAIAGGLFVATILTLVSFPAIYAAAFRVKEPAGN